MWRRVNTLTGKAAARFSIVSQEFASLIACVDGLRGFPEAIEAVYPRTEVQLCIAMRPLRLRASPASGSEQQRLAWISPP